MKANVRVGIRLFADAASSDSVYHSIFLSRIFTKHVMNRRLFPVRTLMTSVAAAALLWGCSKSAPDAPAAAGSAASAAAGLPAKIVVGLDDNFPPMGFRGREGRAGRLRPGSGAQAGKRMGVEMEFKPIDWSAKEAELNGKRVDLLWNGTDHHRSSARRTSTSPSPTCRTSRS